MSGQPRILTWLQRDPAVRLRREAWGGLAFHRDTGDLLELDRDGFDVVRLLGTASTAAAVAARLRARGSEARWAMLACLLRQLEAQGIVRRVAPNSPSLPADPLAEEPVLDVEDGLRAPIVAHWAVTYRCNLSCAFCYSESGPGREAGPKPQIRRRIVERLADWGVLEVALGGGEPTLLANFPELLATIRAWGMVPNVTTNGTVHRPETVAALAEYAGVVHLSADQPDRLDAARGPGVFARLRRTARDLTAAGVRLGVNLLLTPANVRDLPRSLEAALELGARSITLLRPKGDWAHARWTGFPSADDLQATAAGVRAFLAGRPPVRMYVDTALRGEWADLGLFEDPEPEVAGCGGGQRHVAITPEGEVFPCSHARSTAYRMGNLLTDGSDQIWSEDPGRAARRQYIGASQGVRCTCQVEARPSTTGHLPP
ncbi:MAG TPA: radical SAM protein [Isosphaeraceae bacterium]|nr:radical SAM protein [Isosphaeraceae bacterium]